MVLKEGCSVIIAIATAVISIALHFTAKGEDTALYQQDQQHCMHKSSRIRYNFVFLAHHTCTHAHSNKHTHTHTHTLACMHARTHAHTHG